MAVADHLGRTYPSLNVHRITHRAGALQSRIQRALRIDRRLLGDRQVLAAGCFGGSRLPGTLGRFGTGRCLGLGLAALRVQPCLLGQTLALPTLLFVTAALLLAATFQLLLALLLGFALPFGALEGQVGLLHLWRWCFDLNGGRRRFDRFRDRRFGQHWRRGWQADQLGLHHLGGNRCVHRRRPAGQQQGEQPGMQAQRG